MFNDWKRYIMAGFHLGFYGLGSKSDLINSFSESALSDGLCVILDGSNPNLTLSLIADELLTHILDSFDMASLDTPKKIIYINEHFSDPQNGRMYLIIKDIDELSKNNVKIIHSIVDDLCAAPAHIHLMVTVNYIYSPVLIKESLNFLWIETNTFEPFQHLIDTKEEDILSHIHKSHEKESTVSILASTGPKVIQTFCVYIHYTLRTHKKEITEAKYYSLCSNLLIASGKKQFREVIDILLQAQILKKTFRGISSSLSHETLKTILREQKTHWSGFKMAVFE